MGTTKTSPRKIPISSGERGGFTLIETLVVIALIALLFAAALPSIGAALRVNISNSARDLATTVRAAFDEAILKGQIHRVAIDVKSGEYWVESGPADFLLQTAEQLEEEKKKLDRMTEEERKKAAEKSAFGLATAVTRRKMALARSVHFLDVATAQHPSGATDGVVYAHIFPHGFMERLLVHLKDDYDRQYTIAVNPVNGKSRVLQHYAGTGEAGR